VHADLEHLVPLDSLPQCGSLALADEEPARRIREGRLEEAVDDL
jgi:hypothetical protein